MRGEPRAYPQRPPDVVGAAELRMRTTPAEVIGFILDVDRYRSVDRKIGKIHFIRTALNGGEVTFQFTPRLGPLPPLARSTQRVTRVGEESVSIVALPSWVDRLARFRGSMTATPEGQEVLVQRRLEFWLAPPLRLTAGPVLRRWLARDVPAELAAVRRALEADA